MEISKLFKSGLVLVTLVSAFYSQASFLKACKYITKIETFTSIERFSDRAPIPPEGPALVMKIVDAEDRGSHQPTDCEASIGSTVVMTIGRDNMEMIYSMMDQYGRQVDELSLEFNYMFVSNMGPGGTVRSMTNWTFIGEAQ